MLTSHQIRRARELLKWSRAELSFRACLPLAVVEGVEEQASTIMLHPKQMEAVVLAFEEAGVEFVPGSGAAPGVRLRPVEGPPRPAADP